MNVLVRSAFHTREQVIGKSLFTLDKYLVTHIIRDADRRAHSPARERRRHTHVRVAMARAEQIALSLPSPKQTLAEPTNASQTVLVAEGVPDSRERCIKVHRLSADTQALGISRLAEPNRAALAR